MGTEVGGFGFSILGGATTTALLVQPVSSAAKQIARTPLPRRQELKGKERQSTGEPHRKKLRLF